MVAGAIALAAGAAGGRAETQPDEVVLTVTLNGVGEVAIDPAGAVCASSCSQPLPAGTTVTLVATPGSGAVLASWGEACAGATGDSCELTLAEDTSVTATFAFAGPPPVTTTAPPPPTETVPPPPTTAPPPPTTAPPPVTAEPPPTTTDESPPAPGATPGQKALDAALEGLPVGRIAFNVPEELGLGETATIHLVLSLREAHAQLEGRIAEAGEVVGAEVRVSDDMEARLSGADFEIVPLGDERKSVSAQDTTEWSWHVTPLATGVLELRVTLSAFVRVAGEERKRELRVFSKQLEIRVGWAERLGDFVGANWQWLWTAILVPLSAWVMARRRHRSTPHRA